LGFFDHAFDASCKHAASAFPVLRRRCRVSPQQPASRPLRRARHRSFEPCTRTDCVPLHRRDRQSPGCRATHAPKSARRRCRSPAASPSPTSRNPSAPGNARSASHRANRSSLERASRDAAAHRSSRSPSSTREPPHRSPEPTEAVSRGQATPRHDALVETNVPLAAPAPLARPAEAGPRPSRPRSETATRAEARAALTRPMPAKPSIRVTPNRAQPARLASTTEAVSAHHHRAAPGHPLAQTTLRSDPPPSRSAHATARALARPAPRPTNPERATRSPRLRFESHRLATRSAPQAQEPRRIPRSAIQHHRPVRSRIQNMATRTLGSATARPPRRSRSQPESRAHVRLGRPFRLFSLPEGHAHTRLGHRQTASSPVLETRGPRSRSTRPAIPPVLATRRPRAHSARPPPGHLVSCVRNPKAALTFDPGAARPLLRSRSRPEGYAHARKRRPATTIS